MWESLADLIVFHLLGLNAGAAAADALHYFIHEGLKIGFLLLVVTHVMGLVNAVLPVNRVRRVIASGRLRGAEHLAAAGFGAVTPFCSCSSIPLFIGFLQGGIPLGVTLSFLITSPLVNEVALALFLGLFGWKVTLAYAAAGIGIGTALGYLLGRLGLERYLEAWVREIAEVQSSAGSGLPVRSAIGGLWRQVSGDALAIVRRVAPYVVVGIALGAAIHGLVPAGYFEAYISKGNPLAVPVAVLLAVPLYSGAAGVIPVVQTLVTKGVPLGTALAFMMAVVGLSLPEAMILKKVMTVRLLGYFFGSVTLSIIVLGYGFNLLF